MTKKKEKIKSMTPEKAKEIFEKLKANPENIMPAPTDQLKKVRKMAYDFVEHCCLGHNEFFMTDWSQASDFNENVEEIIKKARERYGVDISSEIDKPVVEIAGYILREKAN